LKKKCNFVFSHIDDSITKDVLEALLCNLSGKALCVTQHKKISNVTELINILRANFGNNYSEQFLHKHLNSIIQGKTERVQDYASRIELALYQLSNEMIKNKTKTDSEVIIKVITRQAQNIFIDGLHS